MTRITRILYPIAMCDSDTRCLYSLDPEITVLREVDIFPSRYASSGYYEARRKEDLRVANQTYNEPTLASR